MKKVDWMFQGSIEATELFTRDTIVSARWLFFIISGRITQIIWHHMEFFLHIIYFLCSRRERQGLQGVLFRRRRGKKKLYVWWGGRGGWGWGRSRGLVGRSKHAQRKYASCTRWTWGLRRLLSRLQERPVLSGAGERNHAVAVHMQQAFHWTLPSCCYCCFHFGEMPYFKFPINAKNLLYLKTRCQTYHTSIQQYLSRAFNLRQSQTASVCCSDNRSGMRSPLTPGFLPSSEPAGIRAMYPLPHPWALDHTKVGSGRWSGAHCDEVTKSPLVLSTAIYEHFTRGNHKDNKPE